jgi:HEAT repeat protein
MGDINSWIEALGDDDYDKRMEAVTALVGARAVEPLISVLEDKNRSFRQRKMSAYALGKIGDKRAVEPMTRIAKGFLYSHENREKVRIAEGLTEDEHQGLFMEAKASLEKMGYRIQIK